MAARNKKRKSPEQRQRDRSRRLRDWIWAPVRILLLAALGVGLGFGAYQIAIFLRTSPALAVRQIEVHNIQRTPLADLLRAGQVQEGMNIFGVDLKRVERRIEDLPWIRRASVNRIVPDRLVIDVEEHRPVALTSLEGLYLVSDQGALFKRLQPGEQIDLPILTGLDRDEYRRDPELTRRRIRRALSAVALVKTSDCLSSRQVAEVHLDELMGISLVLDPGALSIRLGRQISPAKIDMLCGLFAELENRNLVAERILLDREDRPNWATVRLAEDGKKSISSQSNHSERI